jgi:hypothetical protein
VYLKILDGVSNPVLWPQCSKKIIEEFNEVGVEVWGWGYHHAAKDYTDEVAAIEEGFKRGIGGYVFDV